jgi:Flp pilus assembly pilin Flp
MSWLNDLLKDDHGQDLAEYAIALSVIAIGVALISIALGGDINTIWSKAQPVLQIVVNGEP